MRISSQLSQISSHFVYFSDGFSRWRFIGVYRALGEHGRAECVSLYQIVGLGSIDMGEIGCFSCYVLRRVSIVVVSGVVGVILGSVVVAVAVPVVVMSVIVIVFV